MNRQGAGKKVHYAPQIVAECRYEDFQPWGYWACPCGGWARIEHITDDIDKTTCRRCRQIALRKMEKEKQ